MKPMGTKTLSVGCILLFIFSLFCAFALLPQPVRAQTTTVTVGWDPWNVAVTPDGAYVYVTSLASDTASVISTATNTVTTTIPVGSQPEGVAISSNGEYAYVTNFDSDTVSVINTATNSVTATVNVGWYPEGVAVTPNCAYVYVTNYGGDSVSVINTATNNVTSTVTVGSEPEDVAVTPDGAYAYVTNYADGTVSVISTATNTVTATVTVGGDCYGVAVTPNDAYAYVANYGGNSISVISTATNLVTATITGLNDPYDVAVTTNGAHAYVTTGDSVSAINTATNTVTGTIPIGIDPSGLAVTPNGEYVYVAHSGNNNFVSVINTVALTTTVSPSSLVIDLGQSTTFTAYAFGGSGSYTGYQWYVNGSAQSGQIASTFSFTPGSAGSYSITATVTDSSGATSTQSIAAKIAVNVAPTVSIAPVGPLSLPVGQVQLFTATASGGSGKINYQWYLDGSAVGTDSASYSYITAAGSHNVTCTVTDSAPIPVTSPASNAASIISTPAVSGAAAIDNSWTEKAAIPSTTSGDEAAVVNGTIYIFGLTDYAYNPSNDTLTTIAPMLTPRVSFAVAACGNKIYVIGGFDEDSGSPYSVNEVYDPSTNTWATVASMPTSRGEMQADTINGVIYVMGGRGADTYSTNVNEIYNPATDSWSTGASMPYPVASAASAVVNNNIYVIGGEDDNHPPAGSQTVGGVNSVNFNQIYNPATDSWSLGAPIPTSTLAAGAGATAGLMAPERIYVFGNIVGFLVSSNQNYAYDPATNSWTNGAPMPYTGASLAVAVVDDLVYVMGDGQNVEQYTPIGYSQPTVTATTASGATVELAISGNITSSQMSNITIATNPSAKTTTVSFTLNGESGTTGFGNITIPKSAVPYGTTPTLYIDGQPAQDQGYTQDANNYYVWYTTQFSTHEVSIVFTTTFPSPSPTVSKFPVQLLGITLVASMIIVLSAVIIAKKRITLKS